MKYRIVEVNTPHGRRRYVVERKCLGLFWVEEGYEGIYGGWVDAIFDTEREAEEFIERGAEKARKVIKEYELKRDKHGRR